MVLLDKCLLVPMLFRQLQRDVRTHRTLRGRKMLGRRTKRLHTWVLGAAVALTCAAWAARASADGLPSDPGASSHCWSA